MDTSIATWGIPMGATAYVVSNYAPREVKSSAWAAKKVYGPRVQIGNPQAALDALPSSGGHLVFSEGGHSLTAQLSREIDDVRISGAGAATLLSYNDSTSVISAGSQDGWLIEDLGTDAGYLDISSATNSRIKRCWDDGTFVDSSVIAELEITDLTASQAAIGDSTNYTQIESDGTIKFNGNAAVWDDLRVPITSTKLGGSKDPTFAVWKTNGAGSQGVFLYWFSKASEKELYFVAQLSHAYKEGSNITPHVHWIPVANGGANKYVQWGLEYTWTNIEDVGANSTIITTKTTIQGDTSLVAGKHYMSNFSALSGTGKGISSILAVRIFRDASNDDYNDVAGLLEIDFHFEIDTVGSRQILTK